MKKEVKTKVCTRCAKRKRLIDFPTRTTVSGTYPKPHCRDCNTKLTQEWIKKNKKRYNEYQKEYFKNRYRTDKVFREKNLLLSKLKNKKYANNTKKSTAR